MFATGWVGMTAGWLRRLSPILASRPHLELLTIVIFAVIWGFAFGAFTNLWFRPYVATGDDISWRPGDQIASFAASVSVEFMPPPSTSDRLITPVLNRGRIISRAMRHASSSS